MAEDSDNYIEAIKKSPKGVRKFILERRNKQKIEDAKREARLAYPVTPVERYESNQPKNRLGKFLTRAKTKGGFVRGLYGGQVAPVSPKTSTRGLRGYGKRGRPRGTLDPRYAKYGGVYGYRKWLSTQLRIKRMEALRSNAITPEQQQILRNIEARKRAPGMSREAQIIPDTDGGVDMNQIFKDINDSANMIG